MPDELEDIARLSLHLHHLIEEYEELIAGLSRLARPQGQGAPFLEVHREAALTGHGERKRAVISGMTLKGGDRIVYFGPAGRPQVITL